MRDNNSIAGISQEALDDLFCDVLEIPADTRMDWLQKRCDGNQPLVEEILSLLAAHENSGAFLSGNQVSAFAAPEQSDYTGMRVGAWQLESKIGQGGMGTVYKARRCDGIYEQTVAVKVGPAVGLRSELFVRERQVLASLDHPVITTILDAGDVPNSQDAYLVMEYINGVSLLDYVQSKPELTQSDKAGLIRTALDALHQAHSRGVIHCDIKPENILVSNEGDLKLLDFGIASHMSESKDENQTFFRGITPAYASPQRLNGASPELADDIYGMGLMFAMVLQCNNKTALSDQNKRDASKQLSITDSLGQRHINPTTVPVEVTAHMSRLARNLDHEPRAIFRKATHADASQRYPNAQAFVNDIDRWIGNFPVNAYSSAPTYQARKFFQRHRFSAVAAGLLVGVLGLSAYSWQISEDKKQVETAQQAQVHSAIQLSKKISQDLDLHISQLAGSLPVRIATAETTLFRIEDIHQQQPNSPDVKAALAEAHLHLQGFYFQPAQMHIGEIERGRAGLLKAYELAHEAYELDSNPKNLMVLVKATRRITENLMIVEKDWQTAVPFEKELLDEFYSYNAQDGMLKAVHKAQLFASFRLHMMNGENDKAKQVLDKAMGGKLVATDGLSLYEKELLTKQEARMLELAAVHSMVTGDFGTAKQQFARVIDEFRNNPVWNHKRRSLYAYRSLACIALLDDAQDYMAAHAHLINARLVASELTSTFPNSSALQWEYKELEPVDQFGAWASSNPIDKTTQHQAWINRFGCSNTAFLHMPAPPPGGWHTLIDPETHSLKTVLRHLK